MQLAACGCAFGNDSSGRQGGAGLSLGRVENLASVGTNNLLLPEETSKHARHESGKTELENTLPERPGSAVCLLGRPRRVRVRGGA
jgi:hypothetical protein